MKPGLAASIQGECGASAEDIIALRDAGLARWAEMQLPRRLDAPDADLRARVTAAAGHLELPVSLHSEVTTFAASCDAEVRDAVRRALVGTIELADRVSAGIVTIHPPLAAPDEIDRMSGGRWTDEEQRILKHATDNQELAEGWFRETLAAVRSHAEKAGVVLAVENMRAGDRSSRLNRAGEIARLAADLDTPSVRICLDVRKATQEGVDPCEFIRRHAHLIADVHASGFTPDGKPAAIGEGSIDWAGVAAELCAVGYGGPLIYEGPPAGAGASLEVICAAIDRARTTCRQAAQTVKP